MNWTWFLRTLIAGFVILVALVYTLIVSVIILYLVKAICGGSLRASESEEEEGLDLTAHGESGYNN